MPIRGGFWPNGGNAGVFALNLNNPRTNVNTNIGFRPALGDRQKLMAHVAISQRAHKRILSPRSTTEKNEQEWPG